MNMKKKICYFLTLIVLSISLVFGVSTTSYAYTEEEKQMAKDWLSAHGYPPTMDGAYQAYQDYLNGKFDEELGVDVNGDGIPSTEETTEATTEEIDVEKDSEISEKKFDEATTQEDTTENVVDEGRVPSDEMSATIENAELESAEYISKGMVVYPKSETDRTGMGAVILYQEQEENKYAKSCYVIIASTILMIIIHMFIQLKR